MKEYSKLLKTLELELLLQMQLASDHDSLFGKVLLFGRGYSQQILRRFFCLVLQNKK